MAKRPEMLSDDDGRNGEEEKKALDLARKLGYKSKS